ncbi:putative F-box/kelch-repeat protein At3g17540 [Cryptomeria japonica]|uniref:putative F-box/kelch-repeat protein At3g17540 n=1 Tax=Cryptomeria japonica TaxID=3369 RepID=UPI0027DA7047|nr:putative F-box/kelch-repeat protein At3g17540 [Cryptomeria japonica]
MQTSWNDLPEQVQNKILAGLPITKFMRLRCVCKQWWSLYHNVSFVNLQATLSQAMVVEIKNNSTILDPKEMNSLNRDQYCKEVQLPCQILVGDVLGHGDGFLCFFLRNNGPQLLIWNPITGQSKTIRARSKRKNIISTEIFYDKNSHRSFRLMHVEFNRQREIETWVYSSIKDNWQQILVPPQERSGLFNRYYSLGIYFLCTNDSDNSFLRLITFYIEREEWVGSGVIVLPSKDCILGQDAEKQLFVATKGARHIFFQIGKFEKVGNSFALIWSETQILLPPSLPSIELQHSGKMANPNSNALFGSSKLSIRIGYKHSLRTAIGIETDIEKNHAWMYRKYWLSYDTEKNIWKSLDTSTDSTVLHFVPTLFQI